MRTTKAEGRIFMGLQGRVLCLDRADGRIVWSTNLPGGTWGFVTVVSDVDGVFASASGEVCRLDPATGAVLWHNPLKGYGVGYASFALQRGDAYDLATNAVAAAQAAANAQRHAH